MIQTRFDITAPVVPLGELGRVHIIAIGGAGMSAVARLLHEAGLEVTGSDVKDSDVLRAVAEAGLQVWVGHDASHIDGADTIVVSSAIRDDNVELAAARERGLRVLHRSQALASVMEKDRRIAVAGANGKTTTTAMVATVLIFTGADPSFAIGGDLAATHTNAGLGGGDCFVVEADESDGSFLAYHPDVAVVTNVQPDHLDFYGSFEAVEAAYAEFAATIRPGGVLVTCADDAGARRLADTVRDRGGRVITYGQAEDADVRLTEVSMSGMTGSALLTRRGGESYRLTLPLPGLHNLLDAAAAFIAATDGTGADPVSALAALAGYGGVRRRFEVKGTAGTVTVIDDYAHNAGKVEALVLTARELVTRGRLVVAFQPHLYSRTRDFAAEFAAGLAPADVAVVLDVFGAREDPIEGVSGRLISDVLQAMPGDRHVVYVPDRAFAAERIAGLLRPDDVLLTVGAGDITGVGPQVLALLEGREGTPV
ncbi:MAG: UDP-N-acetylmuramate--L-alanine ligase [Dermatophilus congolensis]|nr:UDP-N-acetylmuramate--L-alanine ligase [Dermatophilus congolensis]